MSVQTYITPLDLQVAVETWKLSRPASGTILVPSGSVPARSQSKVPKAPARAPRGKRWIPSKMAKPPFKAA